MSDRSEIVPGLPNPTINTPPNDWIAWLPKASATDPEAVYLTIDRVMSEAFEHGKQKGTEPKPCGPALPLDELLALTSMLPLEVGNPLDLRKPPGMFGRSKAELISIIHQLARYLR